MQLTRFLVFIRHFSLLYKKCFVGVFGELNSFSRRYRMNLVLQLCQVKLKSAKTKGILQDNWQNWYFGSIHWRKKEWNKHFMSELNFRKSVRIFISFLVIMLKITFQNQIHFYTFRIVVFQRIKWDHFCQILHQNIAAIILEDKGP